MTGAAPGFDSSSLQALADLVDSREPLVRQFLVQALAEAERLSAALSAAERRYDAIEARTFLDGGHRRRLEDLIMRQEADLARATATIERVKALAEMAQWAARTAGPSRRVSVLVDDLLAALAEDVGEA